MQLIIGKTAAWRGRGAHPSCKGFCDPLYRQHKVDVARFDGTLRHAGELCLGRVLGQRPAPLGLDLRHPFAAIGARARQHDGDGARPILDGERIQECVQNQPCSL